jgi:glycerol-3-phosphate dehydrogenase (NAD(P)+)
LRKLAKQHGVEMPISDAVAAVVEGEIGVDEAIIRLLARPTRGEGVYS